MWSRLIVSAVSALGFVYFLTIISINYFAKETVTSFNFVTHLLSPGLSVCTLAKNPSNCSFIELPRNQDHNNFIEQIVYEGDGVVNYSTTFFTKFRQECYRIDISDKETQFKQIIIKFVGINESDSVSLYIHERAKFPFGNFPSHFSALQQTENYNYLIDFTRTVSVPLKHPYDSNCVDYVQESARISREECLDTCLRNGKINCHLRCSLTSCNQEVYDVIRPPRMNSEQFQFTIKELSPTNYITYEPRFPFELYMIYMSSLIAATFGFNVVMFSQLASYLIAMYSRRKLSKLSSFSRIFVAHVKRTLRLKRFIRLSFYMISLAGFLYQTVDFFVTYVNHEVIKETYLGPPTTKQSPAVSLCIDFTHLIRSDSSVSSDELLTMSGDDIIANTQDIWTFIKYIITAPEYSPAIMVNETNRNLVNITSTFLLDNQKCLKVSPVNPTANRLCILFITGEVPPIYFYLHDSQDWPRSNSKLTRQFVGEDIHAMFRYTYTHRQTNLLESPFDSNCVFYQKYRSRQHCIESCLADLVMSQTTQFPKSIANSDHLDLVTSQEPISEENKRACDVKCNHPDCKLDEFTFLLAQNVGLLYYEFSLLLAELQFRLTLSAKISTNDFLICLLSSLGIWMGVSMISPLAFLAQNKTKFGRAKLCLTELSQKFKLSKVYITVLSLCCLYHVYTTISFYLERNVLTKTTIEILDRFSLPWIVIGTPYIFITEDNYDFQAVGNFSPRDVSEHTEGWTSLVSSFEIRDPVTLDWIDIRPNSSIVDIHARFLYAAKTFFFSPKFSNNFTYNSIRLRSSGDTNIIKLKLKEENEYTLVMLFSNTLSNLWKCRGTIMDAGSNNAFAFSQTVTQLLPYPYKSNCFDYNSSGIVSNELCLNNCQTDYIYRTKNYVPRYRLVHESDTRFPSFGADLEDEFWIADECVKKCTRPDCNSISIKNSPVYYDDEDLYHVVVKVGYVETKTKVFPRQRFEELLVFLAGVVGLWLGLSAVDILHYIFERLKILFVREYTIKNRKHNGRLIVDENYLYRHRFNGVQRRILIASGR